MNTSSATTSGTPTGTDIDLVIGGMTCASCAARIEKRLNKLDGVTASVNYATERARVTVPDNIAIADLVAQVEDAGYSARVPEPPSPAAADREATRDAVIEETAPLRTRLLISIALSVPVILVVVMARDHLGRRAGRGLIAASFACATAFMLWRMEWFDVWRHGTPSLSYLATGYLPYIAVFAICGWVLGGSVLRGSERVRGSGAAGGYSA